MALGHVATLVVEGEGERLLPSYPLPTKPVTSMYQLVKKKVKFFSQLRNFISHFSRRREFKKYIKY